jgi:hypothetical protein
MAKKHSAKKSSKKRAAVKRSTVSGQFLDIKSDKGAGRVSDWDKPPRPDKKR